MLIHGNVTPVTAGSPVEWLRHSLDQEADDWSDLLDRYLEGWAENNLSKISSAMSARILFRRSTRGTVLALVHFAVLRKGSDKIRERR